MVKKTVKTYSDAEFAKRLRTLMGNRDMKLKDLARATGNAVSTVSTWKRGRVPRKKSSVSKLAFALQVSADDLVNGDKGSQPIFSNEREDKILGSPAPKISEIEEYIENLVKAAKTSECGLEHLLFELKTKIPLENYLNHGSKNKQSAHGNAGGAAQ